MLDILRKFFRFCDERERKEFYISIGLGVAAAIFSAMKISCNRSYAAGNFKWCSYDKGNPAVICNYAGICGWFLAT